MPWRKLKDTEMLILTRRQAGEEVHSLIESVRQLLRAVESSPDADKAICYHGAHALLHEYDGKVAAAIQHRTTEIHQIEHLHDLARENPGDRAALVNYEVSDLELRRSILRELACIDPTQQADTGDRPSDRF